MKKIYVVVLVALGIIGLLGVISTQSTFALIDTTCCCDGSTCRDVVERICCNIPNGTGDGMFDAQGGSCYGDGWCVSYIAIYCEVMGEEDEYVTVAHCECETMTCYQW